MSHATPLAATRVGSLVGPASKLPRAMPMKNTISTVTMITPPRCGTLLIAHLFLQKFPVVLVHLSNLQQPKNV
jgi:hypothetical protein